MMLLVGIMGCQGEEPPELHKEEVKEGLKIEEMNLQPIEGTHQALNNAVGWDRIPGGVDYAHFIEQRLPELRELKEKVSNDYLKEDLGRVIEIVEVELAEYYCTNHNVVAKPRPKLKEEARPLWKEAHRIMHDLDWGLLGNEPSNSTYHGYSEYLESQ